MQTENLCGAEDEGLPEIQKFAGSRRRGIMLECSAKYLFHVWASDCFGSEIQDYQWVLATQRLSKITYKVNYLLLFFYLSHCSFTFI